MNDREMTQREKNQARAQELADAMKAVLAEKKTCSEKSLELHHRFHDLYFDLVDLVGTEGLPDWLKEQNQSGRTLMHMQSGKALSAAERSLGLKASPSLVPAGSVELVDGFAQRFAGAPRIWLHPKQREGGSSERHVLPHQGFDFGLH
jgi:hypothetical protein